MLQPYYGGKPQQFTLNPTNDQNTENSPRSWAAGLIPAQWAKPFRPALFLLSREIVHLTQHSCWRTLEDFCDLEHLRPPGLYYQQGQGRLPRPARDEFITSIKTHRSL